MEWLIGRVTELTEEQYNAVYIALSPSRKAHIDRIKHEEARRRSLMATHVMNTLLARYGVNALVETDVDGKPFVDVPGVFVSISHSAEAVACAVDNKPVGIDIEKMRPVDHKLIAYVCNEREREYVLSADDPTARFFEVWTTKEASYKHDGGATPLRAIDTLARTKHTLFLDDYCITIV